ncbi:MAG: HEAT repeat domain-containing protein [Planctomycetota bacterium]
MSQRAFRICLVALVAMFVVLLIERNRIRSHWWAWRLQGATDLATQGYYLASLAGVGDEAFGAVSRLARSDRSDVRGFAVYALQKMPPESAFAELGRLLTDTELDVREAAATALVFAENESATQTLIRAVGSVNADEAAAAVAALGRINSESALSAICHAARSHGSALVRAQALEAITDQLITSVEASATSRPSSGCSMIDTLIDALPDEAIFRGLLSLERQKRSAAQFLGRLTATNPSEELLPTERAVGTIAAAFLTEITGEAVNGPCPVDVILRQRLWKHCILGLAGRRDAIPALAAPIEVGH